ncbi:GNAT family N-acetyltransferase [Brachybacterium paraconglomeratum]|uniref:GNAT family N-acetyltransferase n=1 Tax=Brachybacterium paraconglomeratum TaxID=173362 RepID=UPI00223A926C|nr:GNAT family N-acetyltransferase [Brachybacterium paraconglomeratum]MCT1436653.1 GNAT family N-acetyltransferase [Brachybacterium paraconglomeratum]
MNEVREIDASEWENWRALRLRALREDPDAFASTLATTLEREARDGEAYWRGYFTRTGPALIAEVDGAPVGMARVVVEDGPAHLYSMWVAPEARGRGVGARLITAGLDWLAAHHPGRTLRLEVVETNLPARRLYSRCGFVVVGPNPEDAAEIVMEHVPDR